VTGPYGTAGFIAPEAYTDRRYDAPPADIWALAVNYCMMVQPDLPWKGSSVLSEWQVYTFGLLEFVESYPEADLAWMEPLTSQNEPNFEAITSSLAKLVEYLPWYSRQTIRSMLEPDPELRASWDEILRSPLMVSGSG
jgi:serine/threonine protein kinase